MNDNPTHAMANIDEDEREDEEEYLPDDDTNNYTAINQLLQDEQISGVEEAYEEMR